MKHCWVALSVIALILSACAQRTPAPEETPTLAPTLTPATTITVTIPDLIGNALPQITPRVSISAPMVITSLLAETSISQALNTSNVTVVKVNIDRIKDPSDNSTANITGGIGSYTATVSGNPGIIIQFLAVNGVPPFNGASFNATTGVFSVAVVASPIQASNTTVAEVVPILTGNTTANVTLSLTFQIISAAGQPELNVPEEASNTITLLRGDADKNGVVSVVDSLAIEQYLVGQLTLTQINPISAASPKHDGAGGDKISVVDALAIKQYLVGQLNAYFQSGDPAPPQECDLGLAAREVVVSEAQKVLVGLERWPDSIFGVLKQGVDYVFFASRSGPPATIAKTVGTLDNPVANSVQTGITIQNMKNVYDYAAGGPVYRDPATGNLLMFYHAEKWPGGDPQQFWALYGMAKSTDGGDTWYDLGEIVTPEVPFSNEVPPGTAPHARSVGLPAAPFIIIGDYFYVYAKDRPSYEQPTIWLTVARARVQDVVAAANEQNTVAPWFKYYNGDWQEPGLGGRASPLEADNAPLRQLDIAYSGYLGRYVAVVTAAIGPSRDTVYLMESPDGLTWSRRRVVDEEPFRQNYPTIIGTGDDPKVTGRQFYVYYQVGRPNESDNFLVRRLISCEPGVRAHTTLSVDLDGSRSVVGRLQESSGAPVAGATVHLSLTATDGIGIFTVYTLSGTVPTGATQAFANLNFLRQTGGTGLVDVAVYDVSYVESGNATQKVPNGDFSQGLQGWSGSGGDVQIQPSDRGPGNMLQITATSNESGFRSSERFSVTPGANFTATFAARVSVSSADAGFFGINFQDASGGLLSREMVVFKPAELRGTVQTDEQGTFHFSFDDLLSSGLALEARYDGDSNRWSSYLRKTLVLP